MARPNRRAVPACLLVAAVLLLPSTPARATDGPVTLPSRTYILTCDVYPFDSDWDAAAVAEFGAGATAAEFTDVQTAAAGDFTTLYDWFGTATAAHVKVSGSRTFSPTRGYFMVGHTALPGGFLVHAYLSASTSGLGTGTGVAYPRINVGSWSGDRRILVDVTSVASVPTASCPPDDPVAPVPDVEPTGPSWVPTPAGGEPSVPPGSSDLQDEALVVQALVPGGGGAGGPRFDGPGMTLSFPAGATRLPDGRLLVAEGAELVAEVCGPATPGGVIEAWSFSAPRLVAAAPAGDGPCHRIVVPVGRPLDGGSGLSGTVTLQFAVPTDAGLRAINTGLLLGAPIPTAVRAGEGAVTGAVPVRSVPLLLVAAGGVAVLLRRRAVAAAR